MGLISFLADCILISSSAAGVRRMTGINLGQMVVGMVKNENALKFTKGFFNVGEWVVDKGINYTRNKIIQNQLNEFKDYSIKTNSTNIQNHHNTSQHHQHNQHQHHQPTEVFPQPKSEENKHNKPYRF